MGTRFTVSAALLTASSTPPPMRVKTFTTPGSASTRRERAAASRWVSSSGVPTGSSSVTSRLLMSCAGMKVNWRNLPSPTVATMTPTAASRVALRWSSAHSSARR